MRTCGTLSSSGATDGGDRAVSPVVGVALLVGITVILALVVAPFVFGVSGDLESEVPSAEFAFGYEGSESLDLGTPTDDFDTPVGQGDGMVTVQFERGDSMDPANVEVRSSVSGGNLLNDTDNSVFGPDDSVREGDVISVAAARGETVQVIWTGPGGEESAIIGDFSVEVPDSLTPPWVPEADVGCEYIEDQLTDSENDIAVSGVIVECDLDQYYPRIVDITIESENGNRGAVVGNVNGTGDIDVLDGGGVYRGYFHSGTDGDDGEVNILGGSTLYSDIETKGEDNDVVIGEVSEVNGVVESTGTVKVEEGSSVSGEVLAGTGGDNGDVDILNGTVGGGITAEAESDIIVGGGSNVGGEIDGYGTVKVEERSSVDGRLVAGTGGDDGTVDVLNGAVDGGITSRAEGDVTVDVGAVDGGISSESGGDITVEEGTIQGRINGTGAITVKEMSTVAGGLRTSVDGDDGDITVTTATIRGDIRTTKDGDITIENTSDVTGAVNSSAELTVKESSTVDGTVTSNSTLTLDAAIVGGDALPRGSASLDCTSSSINGQSCSEYKQPRLALTITETNSPVTQGEDATISIRVKNNGFGGTTDVRLFVDGTEEKSTEFDVGRNKQENDSFEWDTTGASTGDHNVTVASDVDSDNTTVYVSGSGTAAFEISSISSNSTVLAGNALNVTAEVRNTGDSPGTATVELQDFDRNTVDSTTTSIDDGNSRTVNLSWKTDSGDVGTGDVTVDVGTDSDTKAVEVRESYYNLTDIALYRSGQDLDVEVFVNATSDATMEIRFDDESGTTLDSRTESAVSDVYTILQDEKAKDTSGEVVVTLYDGSNNQQDSMTRSWDGGGNGNPGNGNP